MQLVNYANLQNKDDKNSYSRFTNTQCKLKSSSEDYESCIVATNKEIYDYNKNMSQLIIPKKDFDKIKIVLADDKDDSDTENSQEFIIANDKKKLALPNKVVLRFKMWLKFLDGDKN